MQFPSLEEIDKIRKSGYRPQVVGCFLNDKKILFLFKKKYSLWQLPQGGIDNQESIEQAVNREMAEELGKKFAASIKIISLVGHNQVEFPDKTKNSRDFKTDGGEKIFMKGKKYFFIAVDMDVADLNINETEFDDFKWLNFDNAIKLSETIYQRGKQRVTVDALNTLHNSGLL